MCGAARGARISEFQRNWVIGSLAGAAVAMVLATILPVHFGVWLGAPAVVFFGLGFIIPVIVVAIQLGTSLRIPVVGALLVWAVLLGLWVDNHAVGRRAFGVAATGPIDRLTLKQAYELWRSAQPGGPGAKKTMVLVASQGGASRAGYWTAAALAQLHEAAAAIGVDFDSHLFAISSVSGGSVGAVGYAAMLRSAADAKELRLQLLRFAGDNALGPAVTGMLYPDLLQRFLPVAFLPDRAETLERSWEDAWASSGAPNASALREPFLNLAPRLGEPWRPLLIVQGASEDNGRRVLTSGVKFACDEVDADDFLESEGHDVAASTAILNGARFPLISPGGTFADRRCAMTGNIAGPVKDHILDGGYFDNAGAETLREMVRDIGVLLPRLPAVADMRLFGVQREAVFAHPGAHLREGGVRLLARPAQDDEVVRIPHHAAPAFGHRRIQRVEEDVGQQRADHRALRRARVSVGLSSPFRMSAFSQPRIR